MSDEQKQPLFHTDTDWVFGPIAGLFGWIATLIFTGVFAVFLVKAYSATEAFSANISELSRSSKVDLSARLLKMPGIDPTSVAEYLESKNPDEVIVSANTELATQQARQVIETHSPLGGSRAM